MIRVDKYNMGECAVFMVKTIRKFSCHVFMESSKPWIADMTCLENGEVAVIDKWNSKLKVFNDRYKHRVTLDIPVGRTLISTEDNILVMSGEGPLRLFSTGRGLTDVTNLQSTVAIDNENSSLATNGSDVAVLRFNEKLKLGCIQVFNLDKQQRFIHKSLVDILETFEISRYFAFDKKTGNFYVGDLTHNYVVGISSTSEILWKVKLTSWPRGIVVVGDHILVATHFDHRIHCVTSDGRYIGVVLCDKDHISFPLALSYQKTSGRLYVQCNYYGDVLVFALQRAINGNENILNVPSNSDNKANCACACS